MDRKNALYNGITYIDIDDSIQLPPDFEIGRIPQKGDIMCFKHLNGNDSIYYHWEVLYIYDQRTFLYDQRSYLTEKELCDFDHFNVSIYVVMKKINPELGNETWKSIYSIIKSKN